MRLDARQLLLLLCFFLSGLAALIYETAWTRQFAFVFGTSELAVATVLAAYMGGLAAGAGIAGRFVTRVRRPLLVYGLLELGIALAALAVPFAIALSQRVYVLLFGSRGSPPDEGGLASALFFLVCSFAILLVPTGFMGATLPLLTRHAVRSEGEIGSRVGLLYATNTFGAVAGTVIAAFLLLPSLGLGNTVLVAVALNALVFAAAALLARVAPLPREPEPAAARSAPGFGRILPLIALSGVSSFTYEVLWTRLLSHVLGGSVYAFGTMLASFLVGIALGSAFAARLARTREAAARGFALAQLGAGALSLLAYALVDRLPALALALDTGGGGRLWVDAVLAASILLPAALCLGATFPLAVRLAARSEADAAAASARVYAWNTVGAIVGAVGTGFFLLPALGFQGTLTAALFINLGLAAFAATLAPPAARRVGMVAAAALLALAVIRPDPPWRILRADPVSRQSAIGEVVFSDVGRSATVLLYDSPFGGWTLRTNGLQEADIPPPGARPAVYGVAHWLGLLPVLARPELESMLVVGLGGALALEWVPPSVRSIDVVELEPAVIEANRQIAALRARNPLADPRVELHVNDARGALLLMDGSLDAIVSQPSHPWTAGASHLYSREFFELVRERLAPDGVFVQWMGLAFVDEPLVRSLVGTLVDVFPNVRIYMVGGMPALLFLASAAPLDVEETGLRAIAASPETFRPFGLETREDLMAALVLDEAGARKLAEGAPIVRDDWNLLQMRSPYVIGRGLTTQAARKLFAASTAPAPLPAGVDTLRLVRDLLEAGDVARALQTARATEDPALRHGALGLVALAVEDRPAAGREFDAALRLDPTLVEARAGLLQVRKVSLLDRATFEAVGLTEASPLEAAVVDGWRREEAGDWDGLQALEASLAAASPAEPLFDDAAGLRASWRIASRDPDLSREAMAILDESLAHRVTADALLARARAAMGAGEPVLAAASLAELHQRLSAMPVETSESWRRTRQRLVVQALDVLDEAPASGPKPTLVLGGLRRQFQALSGKAG